MFSFIAFVAFYFGILFFQRKAFIAYDITNSISETVLPKDTCGGYADSFTSKSQVYTWLEGIVAEVWQDPQCGDKICESPYEYPGFGLTIESEGCSADCGDNKFTTTVNLTLLASSWGASSESQEAARFLAETQWNLCTSRVGLQTGVYDLSDIKLERFSKDASTGLYYTPTDMKEEVLCWWPTWQQFTTFPEIVHTELKLLNAKWKMLIDAPVGGVRMDMINLVTGEPMASIREYPTTEDVDEDMDTNETEIGAVKQLR
eukprot:gene8871-10514_t